MHEDKSSNLGKYEIEAKNMLKLNFWDTNSPDTNLNPEKYIRLWESRY